MNASLTHRPLAEALVPGQGLVRNAGLVLAFSALTALSAQVEVLLPFTPVPITGQTFAVLLTGVVLGHEVGQKFDNREGTLGKLGYRACTLTRGVRR